MQEFGERIVQTVYSTFTCFGSSMFLIPFLKFRRDIIEKLDHISNLINLIKCLKPKELIQGSQKKTYYIMHSDVIVLNPMCT